MKILILAAGYGTRLKALGENIPKALLDINGKPLLHYTLKKILHIKGLDEIFVVTNNKFYNVFQDWGKALKIAPIKLTIVNDGTNFPEERLGSIGDIHFTQKQENIKDDLLVIGSDNLFDYSLDDFVAFAQLKPNAVSIGLYDIGNIKEATQFGVVTMAANQRLTSFEEKPQQPKSSLIAMCCYYFPKKTLGLVEQYLLESTKSDRAGDYIRWLHEKSEVYGFTFSGKWYDIGSMEAYHEAQEKFKE